jgi:hypothetical protein
MCRIPLLPHVANKTKWRRFAHSDCGELFEEYTDIYINPGQTLRLIPPSKKWTPLPTSPGPNMVDTMIIHMARYLDHVVLSAWLVGPASSNFWKKDLKNSKERKKQPNKETKKQRRKK